jgi:outer membrane protein TolC
MRSTLITLLSIAVLAPGFRAGAQPGPFLRSFTEGPIKDLRSPVLDGYIRLGLDSNLALHQRQFDLEKAKLDLQRAQSLFYPQAGLNSQYTIADGGRSQSIPVGDLLNGVYSSLNQLTGSNKFPQVHNQSIQFLPNDYHDTRMEVSMPILNPDILHNREISSDAIDLRRSDADIYKRDLVQRIRQAYYQFLQAGRAVEIFTSALGLAKENKRVSEKFVENRMATKESVLRAQTQVSQVNASLIEARNNLRNAEAYFNFLLNRPRESEIVVDSSLFRKNIAGLGDEIGAANGAASPTGGGEFERMSASREELSKLRTVQQMASSDLKWDRRYLLPRLNVFYDIGYQGYGFKFDHTQFYQLAGVQLQWTLFKANDNKYKIRQAQVTVASAHDQYRELSQQVALQAEIAENNYLSPLEALQSLSDEAGSARETYRLAEKRFDEGQALQIELIDARTQLTGAELRYSLGLLSVLNRAADLERVTASYAL